MFRVADKSLLTYFNQCLPVMVVLWRGLPARQHPAIGRLDCRAYIHRPRIIYMLLTDFPRYMMTTVCVATSLRIRIHVTLAFEDISIEGATAVAFTENVEQRFLAYGWQVLHVLSVTLLSAPPLIRHYGIVFNNPPLQKLLVEQLFHTIWIL